ncbi:MAG TPA: hypothetical protein PLD73_15925 [Candidatus Hydrogenedentes bacterium]|nr:hypothetical protein [Candidatus Hydrogenedentota bacterium]HPK00029.1 hypothetical protein [Candidatus Hydrogenedentota bacterium]
MVSRKWLRIALLCLVLCYMLAYLGEVAFAASNTDLAEKKGIEGLFKKKDTAADPRAPNKTQKFVGVASFFVMIVVVKYL